MFTASQRGYGFHSHHGLGYVSGVRAISDIAFNSDEFNSILTSSVISQR